MHYKILEIKVEKMVALPAKCRLDNFMKFMKGNI